MAITEPQKQSLIELAQNGGMATNVASEAEWKNASGTLHFPNALVLRVNSPTDLKSLIKKISELNQNAKAGEQITTRAVSGLFDEHGLFKDDCCHGCGSFFKKINPISKEGLKSYSYGPNTSPDVIIEFSEHFYNKQVKPQIITQEDDSKHVIIPTGVTFKDIQKKLAHNHLSLPQVADVGNRSVVGTVLNGVDGLEQYVTKVFYIDHNGEEKELNKDDEGFHDMLVKFRLFGIVTKIEMKTVSNDNYLQKVAWLKDSTEFSTGFNLDGKTTTLQDALKDHESLSINIIPTYRDNPNANDTKVPIPNIQLITLDKTSLKASNKKGDVNVDDILKFFAKNATRFGREKLYDLFYKKELNHLIRAFQMIVAATYHAKRGNKPIIATKSKLAATKISHPQDILKSCLYIPCDKEQLAKTIESIIEEANALLVEQYDAQSDLPQAPVNYINIKIIEGSEHGLAVTGSKPNEQVIAIEFSGNRHATGLNTFLANFKQTMLTLEDNLSPRFDLSKLMPGGEQYFSGASISVDRVYQKLQEVYQDGIGTSPFLPPTYLKLLTSARAKEAINRTTEYVTPNLPVQELQARDPDEMIQLIKQAVDMAVELTKHFTDNNPDITAALGYFQDAARAAIKYYQQRKAQSDQLEEVQKETLSQYSSVSV